MHKLIAALAATAAFALLASASQACDFHASHVTASVPKQEVVAMSTAREASSPVVITSTASTACPAGAANCAPSDK